MVLRKDDIDIDMLMEGGIIKSECNNGLSLWNYWLIDGWLYTRIQG